MDPDVMILLTYQPQVSSPRSPSTHTTDGYNKKYKTFVNNVKALFLWLVKDSLQSCDHGGFEGEDTCPGPGSDSLVDPRDGILGVLC